MVEGMGAIAALVAWPFLVLSRLIWSLLRLLAIAAVLVGALQAFLASAPAPLPDFELSRGWLGEFVTLAFATAADGWLPLGFAMIFLWTVGTRSTVGEVKKDTGQTKIAIVALMSYLNLGTETEGSKELKERGFKSVIEAWKNNFWLWILLGRMDDDALTAKPIRIHSRAAVTLESDIENQIRQAHKN